MKTYRITEVDFLKGFEALSQSRIGIIEIMDLAINELIIKWYPALVEKEIFALKQIVYAYQILHWGCAPEDEVITRILRYSKKFRTESEAGQALEQLIKKKIVYSVKTRPTWKGCRVFDSAKVNLRRKLWVRSIILFKIIYMPFSFHIKAVIVAESREK